MKLVGEGKHKGIPYSFYELVVGEKTVFQVWINKLTPLYSLLPKEKK